MAFNISDEMPEMIKQYALYYRNIKGRAQKTVDEYCMDCLLYTSPSPRDTR